MQKCAKKSLLRLLCKSRSFIPHLDVLLDPLVALEAHGVAQPAVDHDHGGQLAHTERDGREVAKEERAQLDQLIVQLGQQGRHLA